MNIAICIWFNCMWYCFWRRSWVVFSGDTAPLKLTVTSIHVMCTEIRFHPYNSNIENLW